MAIEVVERGKLEGDLVLDGTLNLAGMVAGSVTVVQGGRFELYGRVTKDLMIKEGGWVAIYGTVCGNVTNDGGHLVVEGTVLGSLYQLEGETRVDPRAIVRGDAIS